MSLSDLNLDERIRWIEYKGKKILYVDYSNLNALEEILQVFERDTEIEKCSSSKLLTLVNYKNISIYNEYMNKVKKFGKEFKAVRENKSALLGIDGAKSIFVKGYLLFTNDKNVQVFDNEISAKEWLISF
ncbi:MAG: hypothetical protein HQK49_11450 [Oligoflexia bacterium]|nr:hypothetical protein [Oligoflexia bacterium]